MKKYHISLDVLLRLPGLGCPFAIHSSHISLAVLLLRLSGLGCPFTTQSSHISLAVLLLRLSGLGCPFTIHSSHISLAVLHVAPQVSPRVACLRCGSRLTEMLQQRFVLVWQHWAQCGYSRVRVRTRRTLGSQRAYCLHRPALVSCACKRLRWTRRKLETSASLLKIFVVKDEEAGFSGHVTLFLEEFLMYSSVGLRLESMMCYEPSKPEFQT
jgi:hypothetical protein